MTNKRLNSAERERQLKLALNRIKRGRPKNTGVKLTIAGVASEAGVSPALIHNCFPKIAEEIRKLQGRSSRAYGRVKNAQLNSALERARELRQHNAELEAQIAKLASINELLLIECRELRALAKAPNVAHLSSKSR